MKASIETITCDWNVKHPYNTWVEPSTGFVGRGKKIPDDSIEIERHQGEASVSIEVTFAIGGDPIGKQQRFVEKVTELLEEFEV